MSKVGCPAGTHSAKLGSGKQACVLDSVFTLGARSKGTPSVQSAFALGLELGRRRRKNAKNEKSSHRSRRRRSRGRSRRRSRARGRRR